MEKLDREHIKQNFLQNIEGISNKEYQKRIWIRGQGPEWDSFDDTVCDFFDIGNPIIDDRKEFGITDIQYQVLVKFRDQFRIFSEKNDFPEIFIDTPEWTKITEMANEVLKAFNYQKKSK